MLFMYLMVLISVLCYANLAETIDGALKQYISDVKNLTFPTLEESY